MKDGYFVLGVVLLFHLGRIIYIFYQKWQLKQADTDIADYRWETYLKLREQILSTKPIDLEIELPEDTETAFATGLEIHTGVKVKIVVLIRTGEIWVLTTKNARKDTYDPKNEIFSDAVNSVFVTAQYNFARMQRKHTSVPEPGYIKFYIYTNNDIYSAESYIRDIISETSDWQELYIKMNEAFEQSN